MINKNDLYDITFALTIIRNDICETSNPKILSQMIKVLEAENNTEDNQIRKAIASVEGLPCEHWLFVHHNNFYVKHQILKNVDVYVILIKLLQSLIVELNKQEFDKAYDIVDSFHCLPEIIADNHFKIPKSYWNTYVKYYRKKWDKDFLRFEQKAEHRRRFSIPKREHRGRFSEREHRGPNTGDGSLCSKPRGD